MDRDNLAIITSEVNNLVTSGVPIKKRYRESDEPLAMDVGEGVGRPLAKRQKRLYNSEEAGSTTSAPTTQHTELQLMLDVIDILNRPPAAAILSDRSQSPAALPAPPPVAITTTTVATTTTTITTTTARLHESLLPSVMPKPKREPGSSLPTPPLGSTVCVHPADVLINPNDKPLVLDRDAMVTPFASQNTRIYLQTKPHVTPLMATKHSGIFNNLIQKSIRMCTGNAACHYRRVAMIATCEMLSGVMTDPATMGSIQPKAYRRFATNALSRLAASAVEDVASNPPLVLATLQTLAPWIIKNDGDRSLVEGRYSWDDHYAYRILYQTDKFDTVFVPLMRLAAQLACSNKFSPALLMRVLEPANRAFFVEKWKASHGGEEAAVPAILNTNDRLTAEQATELVQANDIRLFSYCNNQEFARDIMNRVTILDALVRRYPEMAILKAFYCYNQVNTKRNAFLACAIFWCVYEAPLKVGYPSTSISVFTPEGRLGNIERINWLTSQTNLEIYHETTSEGLFLREAVTSDELVALRQGLYVLRVPPDSIALDMSTPAARAKQLSLDSTYQTPGNVAVANTHPLFVKVQRELQEHFYPKQVGPK